MPYGNTAECKSYTNMPYKSSLLSKPEQLASQPKSLMSHLGYGSYQIRNARITAGIVYAQWWGDWQLITAGTNIVRFAFFNSSITNRSNLTKLWCNTPESSRCYKCIIRIETLIENDQHTLNEISIHFTEESRVIVIS